MRKVPYRLLCTATAAPNDYIELGTSSEALGKMRRVEMLGMFFTHDGDNTQQWRIKGHARHNFWRWVCSWARAIRSPRDMGFDDCDFVLPPLRMNEHVVSSHKPLDGFLFDMPAATLDEQRQERRKTLHERCGLAGKLVNANPGPSVCWCYLNSEGDLLEREIDGAIQLSGSDTDERKEEVLEAFSSGEIKKLVTKPSIAGFGMNWQHCAHQTFFPSHSFEQWYQASRRSWRFGQKQTVTIDIITSEGERGVMENVKRKMDQAAELFQKLVELMHDELVLTQKREANVTKEEIPSWL